MTKRLPPATPTVAPRNFMLDLAPVYIAYVDNSKRYAFVNARYKELYGLDTPLEGRPVCEVMQSGSYAKVREYLERALAGETVEYRHWLTIGDGKSRFFHASYTPQIEDGEVQGVVIYGIDDTQAKLAEEALQASEQRFRSVFENAAAGIIVIGFDGSVLAANQFTCDMFGYQERELLGRNRLNFGHPDDENTVQETIRSMISGERERAEVERRYIRKDGEVLWARSSFSLIHDRAGAPLYFIGVLSDITERKKAQQALTERENLYRSVFENAAVGIARVGPDGKWLEVNDSLCRQLRYSREELLKGTFTDVTHPEDVEVGPRVLDKASRGSLDTTVIEKRYIRSDGSVMWAQVTGSFVRSDDGEFLYSIAVIEDVTSRKQIEQALHDLNDDLEARVQERTAELSTLNQELDAFNYTVSHDLRAPLRSLAGFSEAVLDDYGDRLDDVGRSYLTRVVTAATRMGELLDGLLLLANYSRSRMREVTVDVSEIAHESAQALREEDPTRKVVFEVTPDIIVRGDRRLIQVLIENLLNNAWKYSRQNAVTRIEVGQETQNGEKVIYVKDNGAGFDPRYSDSLFMPFRRLHSADQFKGQGIGLATVKRIVQRHRGRVWGVSEPGEGATFYFTLPSVAT